MKKSFYQFYESAGILPSVDVLADRWLADQTAQRKIAMQVQEMTPAQIVAFTVALYQKGGMQQAARLAAYLQ